MRRTVRGEYLGHAKISFTSDIKKHECGVVSHKACNNSHLPAASWDNSTYIMGYLVSMAGLAK
jgi:hypothetical protein